jgi:CDP-diacylglycerol--serine O-phosphatidyltransferase
VHRAALARFNALLDADLPAYTKEYFVGMPAPAGAIGVIGPLAARMQCRASGGRPDGGEHRHRLDGPGLAAGRQPHPDAQGAHLRGQAEHGRPLLAMLAIGTAAAFVFPYLVILLIIAYVITSRSRCARSAGSPRTRRPGTTGRASSAPRAGRSGRAAPGAARWPGSAQAGALSGVRLHVADSPAPVSLTLTAR